MKTCPACSAENKADSKFCSACGGVLVPGPEATVDHNPAKNASAAPSISGPDSSAHGRFLRERKSPAAIALCPSPAGAAWRGLSRR